MLAFVLNQRVINHFSSNAVGENGRALAEVGTALRLAPRDATVMEYAALVWLNCGFRNRCLQTARRVVAMSPFNMVAWGYVGCSLAWGGTPAEIEEGITVLERLVKVAPNHPSLPYWHFFLSCANAERGNFPAARDHAQTAIDFHPGFCLGWVNLANALGELGDAEGARRAIERAREANSLFNIDNHQRYCHAISGETPDTPAHQTSGLVRAGLLRPWAAVISG
jgi:tetratricopeptide (TPR) repeat protein